MNAWMDGWLNGWSVSVSDSFCDLSTVSLAKCKASEIAMWKECMLF